LQKLLAKITVLLYSFQAKKPSKNLKRLINFCQQNGLAACVVI